MLFITGLSYLLFIILIVIISVTNPLLYFILLFIPYFLSGIIFARIFQQYADQSFKIYAYDLIGAAIGSVSSIILLNSISAIEAVIIISAVIIILTLVIIYLNHKSIRNIIAIVTTITVLIIIISLDISKILGTIPIGRFDEKDFYNVYNDPSIKSNIIESRWSVYGRSDLVEYNHQDVVKQLFIDGSAGSQMYKFGGDVNNITPLLYNLLIRHTTTIPFLSLRDYEKDNILIIGPGGGKEVLISLLTGVKIITGIELNSDFVNIVKEYEKFNGGIYTKFPNVNILSKEGRHFVKETKNVFDIILMSLPSTEQLQSVNSYAMNENYLLTVEAISDYLKVLTPEGRMIFTLHNQWELVRLIVTTSYAFRELGIETKELLDHFIILGEEYAPTIVIKKSKFSREEVINIKNSTKGLPKDIPNFTYSPYDNKYDVNKIENKLLGALSDGMLIDEYIKKDQYDISPVYDDSPYFYKVEKGISNELIYLVSSIGLAAILLIFIPSRIIKNNVSLKEYNKIKYPLLIFILLGFGFMLIEISLFQKLILYLGSPTVSLSILLSSILIGMGFGSYFGNRFYPNEDIKRLKNVSLIIFISGIISILAYPKILNYLLKYNQFIRSIVSFCLILPLGFLLGIPFPSALKYLKRQKIDKYIPWMYGLNGVMTVLGSVVAIIISIMLGFTPAFITGLCMYLILYVVITIYFRENN